MPFLSRVEINPARRGARRLLASPQAMHAAVLAAFPPSAHQESGEEGRVLWRLDQGKNSNMVYVVSPNLPDFTHLVEQAGWPHTTQWESREYDPLLDRIQMGQFYGFRLTANPTRASLDKAGPGEKSRGKVFGHVTASQQLQWLLDRQERLGCTLVGDQETENSPVNVQLVGRRRIAFMRSGARVTLDQATFQGVLRVADPQALRNVLVYGIGRGKAYGCGLLTLAPLPSS